jgi:triphosphoribosyl-dephospho-CoA synthase
VTPSATDVAAAVQLACLLEASAPKPGNVSPGRPFSDMRYEDFLASASAIGPAFLAVGERSIGDTVHDAILATSRWTRTNTNLGIVLLLAPLARASRVRVPSESLAVAVQRTLAETTVDDARLVFAAIRLANPGGLGAAPEQDVAGEPTLSLAEAMRLAADRDDVAHEYATGFDVTFGLGAPTLRRHREDGLSWDDAIVQTFLTILAARPDTHIARRVGRPIAAGVSLDAQLVLADGGVTTDHGRQTLARFDASLRDPGNRRNPGTTADLTAAAIFVQLVETGVTMKR